MRQVAAAGYPGTARRGRTPAWRAYLSPIDGGGSRLSGLSDDDPEGGPGTLFSILCRDPDGIVACFGSLDVSAEDLPPDAAAGGRTYAFARATTPLPYACSRSSGAQLGRRSEAALALNWASRQALPLEYRLLNPLIWDLGPLMTGPEPPAGNYTAEQTAALLDHPAFVSWFWQAAAVYEAAERLGRPAYA